MNVDPLDEPLRLDPSQPFRARVMRLVRDEAEVPPLPFPWRRVVAGLALACAAAAGAFLRPVPVPSLHWILAAFAAAMLAARFARR